MRLADYTDYSMRVLMFCAAHPERRITIADLADNLGLSKNHLMKIVNDLARRGYITTTRGRSGGLRLGRDAREIRVGDVVRGTESDFRLVECFGEGLTSCTLGDACRLKSVFADALEAYFGVLDRCTLADLVSNGGFAPVASTIRSPATLTGSVRRPERPVLADKPLAG